MDTSENSSTPFVYLIQFLYDGRFYIGSRTARGCHPSEIGTTYFSSSNVVKELIREYGVDSFKFSVLGEYASRDETLEAEIMLLRKYEVTKNDNFINLSIPGGIPHKAPGTPPWNKGRRGVSEKTREKLSLAKRGVPSPRRGKKGKPHSKITCEAISRKMAGIPKSEETKQRMSASWDARRRDGRVGSLWAAGSNPNTTRVSCVFCHTETSLPVFYRQHGAKCKCHYQGTYPENGYK